MLRGRLRYIDEHYGPVEYEVYAKDNFDGTKFYLMNTDAAGFTNYMNASEVFDKHVNELGQAYNPYADKNPSDNRRLDVKRVNKFKTNITNELFCLRFAALFRYMQISGQRNYNQNLGGEGDYFSTQRLVQVDDLGYIKYEMGLITELSMKNKFVELQLKTVPDDVISDGVFKELKEKDKYGNPLSVTPIVNVGFKLSSELLGFPYVPSIKKEPVTVFGMFETIEDVIAYHEDKNTSWILDRKYVIVTDDMLESVIQEFMSYDGYIAFDTETTGLKINFKSRTGEADQLVGVVLSKEVGTGYYFPLQHKRFENLCGGDHWYFMEKYMKPLLESKKLIGHNISFDWKVAYIYDINANFVYDTMLAFGVTKRYEEESYELGLKALVKNIFGLDMFELDDFVTGSTFSASSITFADLPYELVRRYAPADADMTLSLFEFLEREAILDKYGAWEVFNIEVNFAKAVGYSEFYGYRIDTDDVPQLREQILANIEKHKAAMFKIAGREFNPSSSKQLMEIMYDELGIEQLGEKRSTRKEILSALAEREDSQGNPLYPFVIELKGYRDNEGIFKNFLKRLHEFMTPDGFIFPVIRQLGTDTGRTSVGDPNYQSYNDPVKKRVIPRKGYIHFDCDFSQIEYRVLASLAKQENLMKEFDDPDLDYHTYQASRMFNIPYALVSKSLRSQSKGINFGLPYGMGDESLGARIFGERTPENTAKAAQLRRKFFQGQEKIEQFFERVRSEGVSRGYTTTHWGRRRYYHRGTYSIPEIRRQAGNHVIQGTAADIYKIAVCRLFNRVVDEGWLGLVLFNTFVHDELLLEVHHTINLYYFFKAWREEFELSVEGFCKLYAGAGVGFSWYDAKSQDLPVQYIDEIIAQYHEDMEWHGDVEKFLKDVKAGYEAYKIRRVRDYITDPQSQGEVIKPIINTLLVEVVGNIIKDLQKSADAQQRISEYNALLGKDMIPLEGKAKLSSLQDYLKVFCRYYEMDYNSIDIKSPDDVVVQASNESGDLMDSQEDLVFQDTNFSIEDYIIFRGYYRDEANRIVHLMDKSMVYEGLTISALDYFNRICGLFQLQGTYQVYLYDPTTRVSSPTMAYITESGYQHIVRTYQNLNNTGLHIGRVSGWGF